MKRRKFLAGLMASTAGVVLPGQTDAVIRYASPSRYAAIDLFKREMAATYMQPAAEQMVLRPGGSLTIDAVLEALRVLKANPVQESAFVPAAAFNLDEAML